MCVNIYIGRSQIILGGVGPEKQGTGGATRHSGQVPR